MKNNKKLRIIFTSAKTNGPSYILHKQNLNKIKLDYFNIDIALDISDDPQNVPYEFYDVALLWDMMKLAS